MTTLQPQQQQSPVGTGVESLPSAHSRSPGKAYTQEQQPQQPQQIKSQTGTSEPRGAVGGEPTSPIDLSLNTTEKVSPSISISMPPPGALDIRKRTFEFKLPEEGKPYQRDDFFELTKVIASTDVLAFGPLRMNNVWNITVSNYEAVQKLHAKGHIKVKGHQIKIDPVFKPTRKLRVHWAKFEYPMEAINKELTSKGLEIVKTGRERSAMQGWGDVVTLVRYVIIKEPGDIGQIPHLLEIGRDQFLVTTPGRQPICLKCRQPGHIRSNCEGKKSYASAIRGRTGVEESSDVQEEDPPTSPESNKDNTSQDQDNPQDIPNTSSEQPKEPTQKRDSEDPPPTEEDSTQTKRTAGDWNLVQRKKYKKNHTDSLNEPNTGQSNDTMSVDDSSMGSPCQTDDEDSPIPSLLQKVASEQIDPSAATPPRMSREAQND